MAQHESALLPKLAHAWGVSAVAAAPNMWKALLQIESAIYAMTMIHKGGGPCLLVN